MSKKLRSGYTTGTCAAAAAKAAVLFYYGYTPQQVRIDLPNGQRAEIPVASIERFDGGVGASVIKDAGDDPDITNGTEIRAEVRICKSDDIIIKGGKGVGRVTKPGLSVPVGEPAINPGPRKMIIQAVKDVLAAGDGVIITIVIPQGEVLAKRTLNPTLGIVGGISVIGTTGIVEPMSEEAFKASLLPQLSVVKALGYREAVFVPGKIGQDVAVNCYRIPQEVIVQTSNFIGYLLENAVEQGIEKVLLFGHPGKIVKVAAGIFYTHNRIADARLETIAAYMGAEGAPTQAIQEVLGCTTTEAAIEVIEHYKLQKIYDILAKRASERATRYVFNDLTIGTAIVTLKGRMLGYDDNARTIGGNLGWNIKS